MKVPCSSTVCISAWEGCVFSVGANVGGLEIFLGYAESIHFRNREMILENAFSRALFPAAKTFGKMREALPPTSGTFRVDRLFIESIPKESWMDLEVLDYRPVWTLLGEIELEGFDRGTDPFDGNWLTD